MTYTGSSLPDNQITGTLSVEMNQSFVLLPEVPMVPRLFDARVGYFLLTKQITVLMLKKPPISDLLPNGGWNQSRKTVKIL